LTRGWETPATCSTWATGTRWWWTRRGTCARSAPAPCAVRRGLRIGFAVDTRLHADFLDELARGPGVRLFDLGSGHGWPGLYLVKTTGC